MLWFVLVLLVVGGGLSAIGLLKGRSSGGAAGGAHAAGELRIVATIPPLAWPARELAPGAHVTLLSAPGASPHGMELTPGQLRALAEADVVLLVGLGLDDVVRRALSAHPRDGREVVVLEDARGPAGVGVLADEDEHEQDHGHVDEHDHAHGSADPHAWLDPIVMREFARQVASAISRATGRAVDAGPLIERCNTIDRAFREGLGGVSQRAIVCDHNAYGYLAARYGLKVVGVIKPVESGEVSPGDLKDVVDEIRAHGVGAIFVEPGARTAAADLVARETGVRILTLDPLGDGDWPALMERDLAVLLEGLGAQAGGRGSGAGS